LHFADQSAVLVGPADRGDPSKGTHAFADFGAHRSEIETFALISLRVLVLQLVDFGGGSGLNRVFLSMSGVILGL
jgi:hypothetical protein